MIIAVIGRPHSEKARVATDIERCTNFKRLQMYTTKTANTDRQYLYMPAKEFKTMGASDVFYYESDAAKNKFFVLNSQLTGDEDVIFVFDNPRCVEKIESLGVPYALVYVDSSMDVILSRAKRARESDKSVKLRISKFADSMKRFDESGEYSLYINTSSMSIKGRSAVVTVFCQKVQKWRSKRGVDEFKMPTIADCYGADWKRFDNMTMAQV